MVLGKENDMIDKVGQTSEEAYHPTPTAIAGGLMGSATHSQRGGGGYRAYWMGTDLQQHYIDLSRDYLDKCGSASMNGYRERKQSQFCKWCGCKFDADRKIPSCLRCGGPNSWEG